MTLVATNAYERLERWTNPVFGRSVAIESRPGSTFIGQRDSWFGEAQVTNSPGFVLRVEVGPLPDPEQVSEALIERLLMAGVVVL